jgi:UDP-sulfoquinovose synthase
VHFGEQRAAPYSMRNSVGQALHRRQQRASDPQRPRRIATSGLDIALVHLGTMGVYGYGWSGSAPIPEGYLTVKVPTPDGDI